MLKFKNLIIFILVLTLFVAFLEIGYTTYLKIAKKSAPAVIKFGDLIKKAWFEPHPYLVYVFKPNNKFKMGAFNNATFTTNSFGFRSTLEYDVQTKAKPVNTLRIATLGGSTTMGVNNDNEIWPYLIGKNLSRSFADKKIEVLNEGLMGKTSLDNFLDLSMRVIDFNCDVYVLYLGVNDYLTAAPLGVFKTDYSHFRKTLYQSLSFSPVELIPDWILKFNIVKVIAKSIGAKDRRNLLDNTGTGQFRKELTVDKNDEPAINTMIKNTIMRNIANMVGVIKSHNPKAVIILSSFYHLDSPEYIKETNRAFLQYARAAGIVFVDVASMMPKSNEMVFDKMHFTKEGDKYIANLLSNAIIKEVKNE